MDGYTRAVSGQRLCKHVPVARQQILNIATTKLQQWKNDIVYLIRAEMLQAKERLELSQICTGVCEERA
jgi:hypothetical protein